MKYKKRIDDIEVLLRIRSRERRTLEERYSILLNNNVRSKAFEADIKKGEECPVNIVWDNIYYYTIDAVRYLERKHGGYFLCPCGDVVDIKRRSCAHCGYNYNGGRGLMWIRPCKVSPYKLFPKVSLKEIDIRENMVW